eukprot:scaffold7052_cov254-Pinguiococcus_pyrenoidosus.AAC.4
MGLLSERGPPDWHPASGDIRAACRVAVDYCKERGFDIAKLALHFSLHSSSRIPVCLVSAPVLKYMTQNVEAVWSALSPDEEVAIRHLRENIFGKLEKGTWEGREVDKAGIAVSAADAGNSAASNCKALPCAVLDFNASRCPRHLPQPREDLRLVRDIPQYLHIASFG